MRGTRDWLLRLMRSLNRLCVVVLKPGGSWEQAPVKASKSISSVEATVYSVGTSLEDPSQPLLQVFAR